MPKEEKATCRDLIRHKDREVTLMECLSTAKSISEAGRMAGYSESYCRSNIYGLIKSDKFQDKLRKHYRALTGALLPKILRAESELIDIILNNPEKLSRHSNTIKQIKQAAGILEPDDVPKQQVINIKAAQIVMRQIINGEHEPVKEISDAEIIDDE